MRPRPLSRREAALGAAMLAALALAWRETHGPDPLRPGPGRAGSRLYAGASPAAGGHAGEAPPTSDALDGDASPVDGDDLRDAPAQPSAFTPLLALAPMAAERPVEPKRAPVASARANGAASPSPVGARRRGARSRAASRTAATLPARPDAPRLATRAAEASDPTKNAPAREPRPSARPAPMARPAASATPLARVDGAAHPPAHARAAARRAARFDLFAPTPAARARSRRERARRPPRFRPILLDRALGPYAIRPPGADVAGPSLAQLSPRQPLAKPDGGRARWTEAPLRWLESVDPAAPATDCRKRDGHWHGEDEGRFYHAGVGRGLALEDAWLWMTRLERRWWALPDAARAPWLRHRERWWVRDRGVWFVLHEGESWAWRHFARWEAEGLIHPATGTSIVYSADYARAAVITPGDGAVLFDAYTGAELARWSESELPPRWRPAPQSLNLPAGI